MFNESDKALFSTREDHNYIMRQIVMDYAFRVTRLVIIIFSISYLICTFWYLLCHFIDDNESDSTFFGSYNFR